MQLLQVLRILYFIAITIILLSHVGLLVMGGGMSEDQVKAHSVVNLLAGIAIAAYFVTVMKTMRKK